VLGPARDEMATPNGANLPEQQGRARETRAKEAMMNGDTQQETRLALVRKPDLEVLGKVNQDQADWDTAAFVKFYEQCSQENVWDTLNSIPGIITGTRGYFFPTMEHMVGVEVPLGFDRVPPGMAVKQVPGAIYAVFVKPQGDGAPWGPAMQWSGETDAWVPLSDQLPWSEDDGPEGCSLIFVPVRPADDRAIDRTAMIEYPLSNEEIAAASLEMDIG